MIQIHLKSSRVERVLFVPKSDAEEDFDLAAWREIRPLVDRIDRKLQEFAEDMRSEQREINRKGVDHAD